jgi:hypothetical protein
VAGPFGTCPAWPTAGSGPKASTRNCEGWPFVIDCEVRPSCTDWGPWRFPRGFVSWILGTVGSSVTGWEGDEVYILL